MSNFLEKTIQSIQQVFDDMLYTEQITPGDGFMQSLDPRVKLFFVLLFVIVGNISHTLSVMGILIIYIILVSMLSHISVMKLLMRVSIVSIIFTGIVALPSVFNIVRPGSPLLYISSNLYITTQGFLGAVMLMARSFVSLSFIYIMVMTTKWADILRSLKWLMIPDFFIAILEMALRYVFLFLELSSDIFLARKSRTFSKIRNRENRKYIAGIMGNLLVKSVQMNEDIYDAMVARGYNGSIRTINKFKLTKWDYLWVLLNGAIAVVLVLKGVIA